MPEQRYENTDVSLKALYKCACGHERRLHIVVKREGREKTAAQWGRCLGGTPQQPMSCDCELYGA
jgi:hypothetical protein